MSVHELYVKATRMAAPLGAIRAHMEEARARGDEAGRLSTSEEMSTILVSIGDMIEQGGLERLGISQPRRPTD